jgi:hypothetical protein
MTAASARPATKRGGLADQSGISGTSRAINGVSSGSSHAFVIGDRLQLLQQFGRALDDLLFQDGQLTIEKLLHELMQNITAQRARPDYSLTIRCNVHNKGVDDISASIRIVLARMSPDNRCRGRNNALTLGHEDRFSLLVGAGMRDTRFGRR